MSARLILAMAGGVAVLALVSGAAADWDPGDPYKMHFPQLPDPFGWDVNFTTPKVIADDWLCIETGPVTDVHFWYSFQEDFRVPISGVHLSIHADDRSGPYSKPGDLLWERDFLPGEFTTRLYGEGDQGWFDPNTGFWQRPDHRFFYQMNVEGIIDPFIQEVGTMYWLDISVMLDDPNARIGWKTSLDHFEDDAVWGDYPNPSWRELFDPITGESLDMAFVIVPTPSTIALLLLAGLAACRRRR